MPSMSADLSPASASALSAASACNWICNMSGMTPSRVVSAAPTMAIDFGFIASPLRRAEEGEGDLVIELLEGDLDRHVELERLGRLRAAGDVGHHARPLFELDDGDRIGRREARHRAVVNHIAVEPALAARRERSDVARRAGGAERPRREIHLAAGIAALQAQFAGFCAVPEMLRLGCGLRPRASSFGHSTLSIRVADRDFDACREFGQTEWGRATFPCYRRTLESVVFLVDKVS